MGKKQAGENTKKVAGNAKASTHRRPAPPYFSVTCFAYQFQESRSGSAEVGSRKEEAEQKKQEAARKKAEKDALLAAEEKDARSVPKNSKTAIKKTTKGLDLSQLDDPSSSSVTTNPALNATGIDNALDALSLASNNPSEKVDRHPERRYKAAYAAYEARRLPELEEEQKGLRRQQRIDIIRKEFEKSPDNPFNQANARFDSTKDEIREIKDKEREKVEARLGAK